MLSLSSPLWLLALLALPLVWWLHRFREYGSPVPVAAGFLWAGSLESGESGRPAARPQPIWWLRALLSGLLVLALCGPRWSGEQAPALTVWLDDSASMFAREQGSTRMQRALSGLEQALSAGSYGPVTLRSLGAPGQTLPWQGPERAAQLRAFTMRPRGEPQLPAPALLPDDRLHWLVSDGASAGVVQWAQRAPLSQLVQVGSSRENVGVTGLAVRRNGAAAAQLSITLRNGGERRAARRLTLTAGDDLLAAWDATVNAGGSRVQMLALENVPTVSLRASITPADALPLDDQLALPAAALQAVGVSLSGRCGPHLRAALAAHPALALVPGAGAAAGLTVHCGPPPPDPQGPALVVSDAAAFLSPADAPWWHAGSGALRDLTLQSDWLAAPAAAEAPATDAGTVLLGAGPRPLITHDAQRQLMWVDLDLSQPTLVRQPEYPLLVAALVERLLGLDEARGEIATARSDAPVVIAPRTLPAGRQASGQRAGRVQRDLSPPLILAVLCLLLVDLLLLLRRQGSRGENRVQAVAGA